MRLKKALSLFFVFYLFLFVTSTFDLTLYSFVTGLIENQMFLVKFLIYNIFIIPISISLYLIFLFSYRLIAHHRGENFTYKYLIKIFGFERFNDFVKGTYKKKDLFLISSNYLHLMFPTKKGKKFRLGTEKYRGIKSKKLEKDIFFDGDRKKVESFYKRRKHDIQFLHGFGDFEIYYFDGNFHIIIDEVIEPKNIEKILDASVRLFGDFERK
jgi:hypothetical protein